MEQGRLDPADRSSNIFLKEEYSMKKPAVWGSKKFELEFRMIDISILSFLLGISLLEIIFRDRTPGWDSLVLENVIIGIGLISLTTIIRRVHSTRVRSTGEMILFLSVLSAVYSEMGRIIHIVFPFFYDSVINRIESALFGIYPTVWMEGSMHPWLTELMMFAYVVYTLLLPLVAVVLLTRGKRSDLERYLTDLVLTNLACYLFYFLVPVAGPSRALVSVRTVPVQGYFFTAISEYMIRTVHLNGGAFPSAHCAATTVMLAALYRFKRGWGFAFLPMAALIFVSTVYGWFHYVTDVVAGIGLAATMMWVTPRLGSLVAPLYFNIEILGRKSCEPSPVSEHGIAGEGL